MKTKNKNLSILLKEASEAYPDQFIGQLFDVETGKELPRKGYAGDGLALFIGNEIIGVYDETASLEDNRYHVYNAIDTAINELRRVRDAVVGEKS